VKFLHEFKGEGVDEAICVFLMCSSWVPLFSL
jgi:hypothetical protein